MSTDRPDQLPTSATDQPGEGAGAAARPTVIYIMGCGRSGSTVLERVLGAIPGYVNVGELVGLFRRIVTEDQRCGCGQPFSECPFWSEVGARAYGGWDRDTVDDIVALQLRVARQRNLVALTAPQVAGATQRADLVRYGQVHAELYRVIAEVAGARVVVDASKWLGPVMALRHSPEVDLRILHLVRDVRGVTYSWAKQDVARPHATGTANTVMRTQATARTVANWLLVETESAALLARRANSTTMRYEDFVERPRPVVARALAELGLAADIDRLDHIEGTTARLEPSHGIGGNPSRFTTGEVRLKVDDAWRTKLPAPTRRMATALGMPHLLRHHYPVTG